jgi:hypothetical protein
LNNFKKERLKVKVGFFVLFMCHKNIGMHTKKNLNNIVGSPISMQRCVKKNFARVRFLVGSGFDDLKE